MWQMLRVSYATNTDLIEASKAKARRKNRERGNDGKARVLDTAEINRRIWDEAIREFSHFTPDIFNVPTPSRPLPRKPTIAAQNRAFQAAVRPLLRLDPSIFTPKPVLQPFQTVSQAIPLNSRQRKSKVRGVLDSVVKRVGRDKIVQQQ